MRRFLAASACLILIHILLMLFRYGSMPIAPVVSDEVVINDASIALARGHGYVAESFADSKYGLDRVFAHFPPVYPYTEALAFRLFGVSAYTLRLTTTVMSIGSTFVLFWLLYRLCLFGQMHWDVALLVEGLYCTSISLASLERVARMESMIGLLVMLSLALIFQGATQPPGRRVWPSMAAAAAFGALTIAVHPEAFTAVLLLVALMLYLVPAKPAVRIATAALFVLVPLAVGIGIYRTNFFTAVHQFLAIAHDSAAYNPSSYRWLQLALETRDVSTANRNAFLISIMLMLLYGPVAYLRRRGKPRAQNLATRMLACLAVVGATEFLLMIFALQMDFKRIQFLFGPLLVCVALCVWDGRSLLRWQAGLGSIVIAMQCAAGAFYLSPRADRVLDFNPERFADLVRRIPAGASLASTPSLWLDLKEANRPFTLILNGLDGESNWGNPEVNPLRKFDIVVLDNVYAFDRPWLKDEAQAGRTKSVFQMGTTEVEVYTKDGITLRP
jgi:4-amino-4-deoxy-L-arabinose transferase-like glycosyltransferase